MTRTKWTLAFGLLLLSHAMLPGAEIAARYCGGSITEEDVALYLEQFNSSTIRRVQYDEETGKAEAIKDIALEAILSASARKESLADEPGLTNQIALTRRAQLKKVLLDERGALSEGEIKQYYESHPEQFQSGARVTLRHIFKEVPRTATPERKEQIRAEAESVLQALRSGGDFAEMAEQHSDVRSGKKKGGLVGPVDLEKLNPALQEALANLEPGRLSDIVETGHGYEILTIEDFEPARHESLEEARPSILSTLRAEKYRTLAQELFAAKVSSPVKFELLEDIDGNRAKSFYAVEGREVALGEFLGSLWLYPVEDTIRKAKGAEQKNLVREIITDGLIEAECAREGLDRRADVARILEFHTNRFHAEAYVQSLKGEAEVSEESIEAYYQEHQEELKGPKRIKARLIRLSAELRRGMSPPERHHAMQRCLKQGQKIAAEIRAGADFAEYAKRYSSDPTALQGGDLGWIRQGPMGYHFDMAAFELEEGETSDPAEYEEGYMVIQVEAVQPPPPLSPEEARPIITARLQAEGSQRLVRRRLREVLGQAAIEVSESP